MNLDKKIPDMPKLERGVKRINKKAVYACIGIFLLVLFVVLLKVLAGENQSRSQETAESDARATTDHEFLLMLEQIPSSYADVKQAAKPAESKLSEEKVGEQHKPSNHVHGEYQAPKEESLWEKAAKREKMLEIEEHWAARKSDSNVQVKHQQSSATLAVSSGTGGSLETAKSPYSLSEGTIIPAILLSKIVSELPGPILAQVSENIFDSKSGKYLLIPQGTKLVGEYISTTAHGQNRAQIKWSRMTLPNQKSMNLDSMPGVDGGGTSGVGGKVDNHYKELFIGLLATSLLNTALSMSQGGGQAAGAISPQAQAGSAVGQGVVQLGTMVAEKNLSIKPTITVESGTKISVFATRQFILEPYSF